MIWVLEYVFPQKNLQIGLGLVNGISEQEL
jgi:hypothetical protein